ncbi:hypothetical protein NFI96_010576 [Prochilodus magdalenae]|nr:hypothetical protein NFI96_010576 [Prochilodus magdalenae]
MATLVHLLLFWIIGAVTGLSVKIYHPPDEDSCPKRSQIDRESLHCYWMSATASTWLEARAVCQRMKGGDIAMVDKPSVQNFIDNSFRLEAPVLVWLRNSISTRITIGQHQHGDGEKGTCSQMTLGLGQWSNSPCNQEHHFICGKEISVSLPSLDSYVIGVPLMSGTYTQSRLQALPLPPDLGQQRVEMMLFPGLWFSHGGQVISLDLVSQPSQVLTMVKVQILRPYCSPTHHLVPPGCSSLLNPFSCCSVEPMCNTTGACISGLYWCHLLESCLPVTSPCSPYHSSAAGLVFPLPPRYPAVPPFYHMMADLSLKIPPASEPVHYRVTLQEKGIPVYPDDIIAVQHSRKAGEFLHCVTSSDSAWQQSYLSLSGPELGGWVEVGVSVPTDGGQWVDNMLCDLRLIYEDPIHLYGVPPVPGSTQSDLRMDATTPTTHLVKPQTPVSGLHVLYPALDQENQIHLPVNVQITIIIKILSGHGATSTWSAPVLRTGIPFQLSCPSDMSEIQAVCKRDTPDVWFSYVDIKLSAQGEQTLNITASNTLNSQMLSVKLQAHIPVTGLSIQPQGFYRVLVDIPQEFAAAVATGSSVKYTWVTDNLVQFAYTGQTYNVVFKKQAEYMLKVTAKNPVSSQFLEVKLTADVMAPLADLTLLSKEEAIAVNTPNIYTLSVKVDISIEVTVRWDFGDTCVNHTFSAPLERMNTSLDQTATQIYLQDSVLYTYTTPGDYTLRIQAENKYDRIKKDVPIKVRSPLTRVLVSSMPAVPKVDQSILFEASSFPSSYGILYTWNLGDGSQELQGPHNKISHVFKTAGIYNVSVCSNNTLSLMIAWMAVEVVEAISGVRLSYNGPNELNSITEINGRVSTGNGLRWTFELGDGAVFKDLPKSSISHIYKSVGNYTAQVTVSNAVSSVRQAIDVEIYQLAINGIQPSDCIMSGKEQQDSMVSRSSESFFPDQVIQCNTSSLILPKHSLEPGSVYQFTLTVQKDGRPAVSTEQSVKIYETEVIPVAVKCVSCSQLFSSYVSHSHPVVLVGHCFLCNGSVKFKWTAENTVGDILHLNEVTTSTGDSAPVLVIRPDVLMAGSKYIFTLNVSMPNTGLCGLASIALKLSSPPQGGSCTLSPEDSVQLLQDRVSFSCSGWADEDRESAQMMYSLQVAQCEDPGPQCPLITLYRGTQRTFSTLVPLGIVRMRDNASIITLMVQVEDDMGAKVTALRRNLAVVFPVNDQVTTAWLKKKAELELSALLQQGNPQDVIPYSAALISLLNQLEAVSVQDFEDRVQMRGNVTRALASLSVSSLQDAAQISSALAHSTAVPSELQCVDCQSRAVEATHKMIKVIREQTKQGDVTPVDTGRNILTVLSNSMTAAQKSKDASGVNYHYKHQDTSETVVSAFQQIGELMQSLMWSRMPGEEALFLKSPQISAAGIRGDPTSNLLCTEPSTHCQFQIPPALSSQLSKESEDVFQVLLVMETQGNPFVSAADPPISTKLAAMEFATPEGLPITIANLTSDTAIHVTLQKEDMDASPRVNITLPSKGSVNFTVRAVEMNPHAGLFITFNFSLIQAGPGKINSGQVNVSVSDQQGFPLSQHNHVQKLNLSLSTDIPSMEETIFLTPLSLCQFFSAEQRHWSTEGVSVLRSSTPNTAHCLTQHLTLFGASLFVHPDAILLLPPSDGPVRNVVVGIVCGVLLLIHLLVGLIAHKLDHLESLRLSCIPLCGQAGRYHYRVLVKTGWQRGAGTSAHVGISLYGLNKSGSRHLQREGAFQRNSLDDFQVETDANLGEIWKICIWHDNTGLDPSWYLQHVVVWDMQMDNMFFFLVEDWLSVENDKNAGMVQKVILATCPQELQHFGRMLRAQLLFGLRDRHLWVSLWERPAHSNFSRAQRVTSCALLLHLYLAGGAVWYGAVSTKDSSGPVADQMLMNPETILVGMTVAVVMFPLQSLLTSLFRMTKSKAWKSLTHFLHMCSFLLSKKYNDRTVLMELSLPPSPVSDTVEMDVYLSHPDLSCSSFLSMPGGLESSTHEGSSPFTVSLFQPHTLKIRVSSTLNTIAESLGSLKLQSELFRTSNMGNESSVDQWASNDSIFGLPELMGPTRLLKRKRALLQLRLGSPASDIPNPAPRSSPNTRKHAPLFSGGALIEPGPMPNEELGSASTDPFLSSTSSGPTTSDSGRYSPDETSLSDFQDRSCSEWSELSGDKPMYEGGLYKSPSSVSVCSVASTFLPSLPPDSCSITSNTRIGVARGQPGVMLPSWVLAVVYLLVVLMLGTCLAMVGLYGSKFSNSVVLMWLISAVSAFLTSVLLLEPLKICVQALYLAAVVKPVDPEVEDRLAQETVVRRIVEEQGTKVRPPCGYSLLQAKEEARKVRMVRTLMRNCLVYMMLLLVVLMVNYQENIQEMNSRLLQSAVKRSITSASRGQPNLTALSGWKEAWQWMDQSLITHLHQNVSLSLIGSSRLQRVQSKNVCGGNTEEVLEYDLSSMMFTASVLSHSNSHHLRGKSNHTSSLLPWSRSKPQSCMVSQTEEKLLGNSSVSTSHILSGLQTAHWITAETQAVLVEFTQYHRETGLFVPVSILLENTQTHRILSTIFIQSFHIPGSSSGLDLNIALTALLLLFSVCILSAELWAMLREGVQYLRQGWHLLQLLLALLSLAAASLRLCFLSKATACLSTHLSQPNTFTDFHSAALLAQRSSQLSAVLLTLLVLQMVGALRFVRRWVVFGKVLRQACCQMCGVFLLFMLLLLLFSHTGSMLFSGSVEGFRTMWQTNQSLLGLLRGRRALHQLCEQHPVLGPIYCVSVFGVGFWLLGRLCGAVLVHTYKTFQAEMYRPSVEPQDYEMVEFLIKRLKLWMGLSKAKEFRHRVRFEGMESPPSRFSRCSQFSSLSVAESPISSSIPSSPAGPRLISSASSLASECSTLSDSPDLQQYLDRLLPSVDSLLAGFDRVNQLTDDVLNIELQLQKACSRMAKNRIQRKDPQLWPQTSQKLSAVSQPDQSQCMDVKSSQQGIPQIIPRRRGTHSESSITGPVTHLSAHSGKQAWQHGQTELDIRSFPRRRAWNSGSCHSADPIQRSPISQNPVAAPVRPRSEEGDRSEVTEGMPIKRRAWHPEGSEME